MIMVNQNVKDNLRPSFFVQWTDTEKFSGEVSEDFINKMSNDEFSFFIKCKLPENYLTTMRDTLLYIGDEIILVTPEEAKDQGLKPEDFGNIPSYKITAPPIMEQPIILGTPGSGQDKRRERRKNKKNLINGRKQKKINPIKN